MRQIVPVSVQQRIGLTAELGQWHLPPVKPVRENLVHYGVFHPFRRDRAPVIHRDLVRRRLLFILLAPASQLRGIVAVIICFFRCLYDKVIPEQAAGIRHGDPADVTAFFLHLFRCRNTGCGRCFYFFILNGFCYGFCRRLINDCIIWYRHSFFNRKRFLLLCRFPFPFPLFRLHGNQHFPGALLPQPQDDLLRSVSFHITAQCNGRAGLHGAKGITVYRVS